MKRPLLNGVVSRVVTVGVELEGGWDRRVVGFDIRRDSSVVFKMPNVTGQDANGRPIYDGPCPKYDTGEIVSPVLKIEQIDNWITHCYPEHVNETCGLHVHMGFTNKLNYSRLITPEYMPWMVEQLKLWGRREGIDEGHMFWKRLDPDHEWTKKHCEHRFLGDKQVLVSKKDYQSRGTDHSRYTFINYCEAQHHTVECRGLPMFEKAEVGVRAVIAVVDATNRFLSKMRQREKRVAVSVMTEPEVYQELGTIAF